MTRRTPASSTRAQRPPPRAQVDAISGVLPHLTACHTICSRRSFSSRGPGRRGRVEVRVAASRSATERAVCAVNTRSSRAPSRPSIIHRIRRGAASEPLRRIAPWPKTVAARHGDARAQGGVDSPALENCEEPCRAGVYSKRAKLREAKRRQRRQGNWPAATAARAQGRGCAAVRCREGGRLAARPCAPQLSPNSRRGYVAAQRRLRATVAAIRSSGEESVSAER